MRREIERDQWQTYLEEFSERNRWRIIQLHVSGQVGAPRVEYDVPLLEVRLKTEGEGAPLAEVALSDDSSGTSRRTRRVPFVRAIAHQPSTGGRAEALEILSDSGVRAILFFYSRPGTAAA